MSDCYNRSLRLPFLLCSASWPRLLATTSLPALSLLLGIARSQLGRLSADRRSWLSADYLHFSLPSAIFFSQNFGASLYRQVRATYRDGLLFCAYCYVLTWCGLMTASEMIAGGFGLDTASTEVLLAFTHIGTAAFFFCSALFVACTAYKALGKPVRSTAINRFRNGLLTLPAALWLKSFHGALAVIYAKALAGILVGLLAAY